MKINWMTLKPLQKPQSHMRFGFGV